MTPEQLAKSGSEHGVQRALFAWIRWAEIYGFEAAWDDESYAGGLAKYELPVFASRYDDEKGCSVAVPVYPAVPELRWCHAIPNGGLRDKITAGKMKQEGALTGILDVFLPLPVDSANTDGKSPFGYAGLYIEMKRDEALKPGVRKALIVDRAAGTTSDVQEQFIAYARSVGYAVSVCFDWRAAAQTIQNYVELYRRVNGPLTL